MTTQQEIDVQGKVQHKVQVLIVGITLKSVTLGETMQYVKLRVSIFTHKDKLFNFNQL